MPHRLLTGSLLFASFTLVILPSAKAAVEPLRYELSFERPNTHLMDVTIHATELKGPTVEFAMPDWAPGKYHIENYAQNIQRFRALGPDSKELLWRKTDSQTWRIELAGASVVTVSYQVFGDTMRKNLAQYNQQHVFFDGPALWMYLVGQKSRPIELSIAAPANWQVATGMERTSGHIFRAADYDWFADAPFEMSNFAEKDFQVLGTTYHVIVHDDLGRKDFTKFVQDLQKFVESIVPIFQPVTGSEQPAPFKDYWFFFHMWAGGGGGGLEHLNSTQIEFSKDWDSLAPMPAYGNEYNFKLFVSAHEFFHAWNVKRIRPRELGPFDYSQMVHTPSLWLSEGLTSYYGWLALERAGLMTPQQYLDGIAYLITTFEQQPGRKERTLQDNSWDAWFPGGVTGVQDNLTNTKYSYYDGGQIVGHILDFKIRQDTNNQKSLDDWMRLLYSRYALPKPGFEPDDAMNTASQVAGSDLSGMFGQYISGTEPIPYEKYFAYAGVAVEKKNDLANAWIGISIEKGDDGRAKIKNVIPGSPAETAGLDREDLVVAVDGRVVNADTINQIVSEYKPGNTIRITLIHFGELREIPVTAVVNPGPTYTLKPVEHPTDLQKRIYNSWLGVK